MCSVNHLNKLKNSLKDTQELVKSLEHKHESVLKNELKVASDQVFINKVYTHYKGNDYVVKSFAINEESQQVYVIYSSVKDPEIVYIRSLSSWLENIDETTKRFELKNV